MRIVKCPNPACGCNLPLTASFWLSKRKKKEQFLKPIIKNNKIDSYEIIKSNNNAPEGTVTRSGAKCICCGSTIPLNYIREKGKNNKIDFQLIATIEDTKQGRIYRVANKYEKQLAKNVTVDYIPEGKIPEKALGFRIQKYGIYDFADLFTKRQLKVLLTYSDLIKNLNKYFKDRSDVSEEYIRALKTYLTFALDKLAAWNSTLCSWIPSIEGVKWTFPRQTLQMSWDFTEINPLGTPPGNWINHIEWVACFLRDYPVSMPKGIVKQLDATKTISSDTNIICSTDPPYYDNIGYASLSDFFYIWMRKILKSDYPDLFSTLMTPKIDELISDPGRFEGDKSKSEKHFEDGMLHFFGLLSQKVSPEFPVTVYYAFKQEESDNNMDGGRSSTGWEKMLQGLLKSGFMITGTWPMRTERAARQRSNLSNALASSIVIVCRLKPTNSPIGTRRDFIKNLKNEFSVSLKNLQEAGIAPVDMAQSAIGPGMAVFSKYSKVLEADGNQMSVRTALQIINQELDAFLTEQESDMDRETRFCIAWYEQFGWKEGPFGDANTLATAKGTAVNALETAEVVYAKAGKVRLLKRSELDDDWDPTTDKKLTVWECIHHLIKRLDQEGEDSAAKIIRKIGGLAESVKELTYRLYSMCEKKGWTEDGLAYNTLISSWQSISDKAQHYDKLSEETKKRLKDKTQKKLNDL
jgi:putative DNA methylase